MCGGLDFMKDTVLWYLLGDHNNILFYFEILEIVAWQKCWTQQHYKRKIMEDTKLEETTEFWAIYGQHMQILVRSFQKMRQISIAAFVI